ncbi:protein phosphatase 1B-like [Asparagus officinalis]|uniref:protein phosphatase 1B-like n=1 Tax=Asparagus officinalis TaxID=4686 RepID=UPI00098DF2B8|nr:protein phosphatase 1B-like [Asparagus officinalis]
MLCLNVGSKCVYKVKYRPDGTIECRKAHLVARDFTQQHGIDYEETFTSVAQMSIVRTILAVVDTHRWLVYQIDVKNVFLHGSLSETVYMQPPPGLTCASTEIGKAVRSQLQRSVINWGWLFGVLGVLATSRSIGDYYLKPYVTSEPEVAVTNRTEDDEFLILASDGLWDVISNEVACKITRRCLSGRAAKIFPQAIGGSSAAEAAAFLAELAMSRGSRDNISVVVVELKRVSREMGQ